MSKPSDIEYIKQEMEKCMSDPVYFYENYFYVKDAGGMLQKPRPLFDWEKKMLTDWLFTRKRKQLLDALKSKGPDYKDFDHPLVKKAGGKLTGFPNEHWEWERLGVLTNDELQQVYNLCL